MSGIIVNSSTLSHLQCLIAGQGSLIFTVLFTMNIVVLFPLCVFILHHGIQDRQRRRSSSSAASMSHSDCFTYNMVVMELFGVFGCLLSLCGVHRKDFVIIRVGLLPLISNYCGQAIFHLLTCVERYLAVMHPIMYMTLKQERGVRNRNILIGCVWVVFFGLVVIALSDTASTVIGFGILILTVLVCSFCSLSVLCALIRPGPGEKSGDKRKVDRSKLRAFFTIAVILITLVLRLITALITAGSFLSGIHEDCILLTIDFWFYLPSSLVLPLLLLHRAEKFRCCRK